MNLVRYMTEDMVKLEMTTVVEERPESNSIERWRQSGKELILEELVTLLENGSRIGNRSKLLQDFINRERQSTTGLTDGVALPHIRSLQAKDFMLAFARSSEGYDFGALDGKPSYLFFVMAAPPYDDSLYLKAFKALCEKLRYESFRQELMSATQPGEILRALRTA